MAEGTGKPSAAVIIAITSLATVGMTVFNGFASYRINDAKAAVEQQAQDLEAAKARITRYQFVQDLFGDVLGADSGKKVLTINLIRLALEEHEAEKLFAGLQSSSNAQARALGDAGVTSIATDQVAQLVVLLNDGQQRTRLDAFKQLRDGYAASSVAINHVLSQYDGDRIDQLTASGRINTLTFLSLTDANAWNSEQLRLAEEVVRRVENRHVRRIAPMGRQSVEALDKLKAHLGRVRNATAS